MAISSDFWRPYEPSRREPWDIPRIVHLHRRAAWGATWREIERDHAEGPEAAVGRLLDPVTVSNDGLKRAEQLSELAVDRQQPELLKAAWITRMWHGPDPLGEQLTLMWHNHFATSNLKVRDVGAMRGQHDALRRLARAPFGDLLYAIVSDSAMLIWLDADSNRNGKPNENLARELLELLTLGEGNFREIDVRECARALTGWTVDAGQPHMDASLHDGDVKEVLGKRGRWHLADLTRILVEHPATSRRIAWRLCDHFLGPGGAPDEAIRSLADRLHASRLDVGKAVSVLLRSRGFFSKDQLASRISPPASFAVSTARVLEVYRDGLAPEVAAGWMRVLGQDLFYPPGVGGWPGGRTWISATSMIHRARFALGLSNGTLHTGARGPDIVALAAQAGASRDSAVFAQRLLFGGAIEPNGKSPSLAELLVSTRGQLD